MPELFNIFTMRPGSRFTSCITNAAVADVGKHGNIGVNKESYLFEQGLFRNHNFCHTGKKLPEGILENGIEKFILAAKYNEAGPCSCPPHWQFPAYGRINPFSRTLLCGIKDGLFGGFIVHGSVVIQ